MNSIAVSSNNLPGTLEDLSKFVLVGREQLVAVRAAIRAIDKVGVAQEVRKQKLKEGQEIAEAVLDAEVRIGELMRQVPKAQGKRTDIKPTDTAVGKYEVIEKAGFTPKQVERFETLAAHPEAVERAKAEARENQEMVTRSSVLEQRDSKQNRESRLLLYGAGRRIVKTVAGQGVDEPALWYGPDRKIHGKVCRRIYGGKHHRRDSAGKQRHRNGVVFLSCRSCCRRRFPAWADKILLTNEGEQRSIARAGVHILRIEP